MYKDKRYDIVYHNLQCGNIKKFEHIFNFIPIQIAAIDMGISNKTLKRRFMHPEKMQLSEIFELSLRIHPSIETYQQIVKLLIQEIHPAQNENEENKRKSI